MSTSLVSCSVWQLQVTTEDNLIHRFCTHEKGVVRLVPVVSHSVKHGNQIRSSAATQLTTSLIHEQLMFEGIKPTGIAPFTLFNTASLFLHVHVSLDPRQNQLSANWSVVGLNPIFPRLRGPAPSKWDEWCYYRIQLYHLTPFSVHRTDVIQPTIPMKSYLAPGHWRTYHYGNNCRTIWNSWI